MMVTLGTVLVFVVLVPLLLWLVKRVNAFFWDFIAGRQGLDVIDLLMICFVSAALWVAGVVVVEFVHLA